MADQFVCPNCGNTEGIEQSDFDYEFGVTIFRCPQCGFEGAADHFDEEREVYNRCDKCGRPLMDGDPVILVQAGTIEAWADGPVAGEGPWLRVYCKACGNELPL